MRRSKPPVVAPPVVAIPAATAPPKGKRAAAVAGKPRQAKPAKPSPPRAQNAAVSADAKDGLHPRSRHRGQYDFAALVADTPPLARFVITTKYGNPSIDFANAAAVKALNQALLRTHYGITSWDIPDGYLCPPIPGRADYVHHVADLLAEGNGGKIPRGSKISVLDIGVGASAIYPLIGHREYGWSFVGTDCDADALASAQRIIKANQGLSEVITLRRQRSAQTVFAGVVQTDEHFDISVCNPPFHASAADAAAGSTRKWHQLGKHAAARGGTPLLNFGGKDAELWCPGGEIGFITRMIGESRQTPGLCLWFTSLVSKESSVPLIVRALQAAHVRERRIIDLSHGQKRSRIVAWTFLDERQRSDWRGVRWQ
jgi:23S rRNA (adenine1618-N6)-methyltransferase